MKIEHIEVINLLYEYPDGKGFQYAGGVCTARVTSLIRVHADNGLVGIGSVYSYPGAVHLIVRDQIDPLLRGEDPEEIEQLWDKMYGLTRWYGRKGVALSTLGGVDTALWDLRGKAAGKPVWSLLGGEREHCPAYASGLLWKDIDELAQEAAAYIDQGFRRVKMRLARSEAYDRAAVRAVRAAIGNRNDIMVDASMRFHLELARRMGRFLKRQNVFWFEEPFAPENIDSYSALRPTVEVPIAAGENEFGVQGFRELIRAGAVDIVQPDASRCGGLSEVWRVAQLAQEHGLGVATHSWSDAVAIIANAHVIAAAPNGITVEVDGTGNPFIEELLTEKLRIHEGRLQLGDAPGLGIELRDEVIERHRMPDPLQVPKGSYSDMMFGREYLPPVCPYEEDPSSEDPGDF
jgi:D-arabinonate dehydratase/D-galactarolactone cycloisomerase